MKLINIFTAAVLLSLLTSCKNDLQLNAPYKEIPSIYAVLNPQENIQMIRVNKVFLGEGDANAMAKVADSVNYKPGELTITLERYVNGVKDFAGQGFKEVVTFHDSVITANDGAFSSTQRVYVTSDRLYTNGEYRLKVVNNNTKNEFTAKANSMDSLMPGYAPLQAGHYFADPTNTAYIGNKTVYIDYSDATANYSIKWVPYSPAVAYQATMRFHYYDLMIAGATPTVYRYVDYTFTRQNAKDAQPIGNIGPFLTNNFKRTDILNAIANSLAKSSEPIANITGRKLYRVDYIVYSSTQDYLDYLDFTAPSLSIAQDKPLYSNFDGKNALGLFTFRTRMHIARDVAPEFVDRIAVHCTTRPYKFLDNSNTWPLVCSNN